MRIDMALVERGLARSRNHASTLVEARRVLLNGKEAKKSSQQVEGGDKITVLEAIDFVSRAGHKLARALDKFTDIDVVGKTCLDVGASTGGFTDVLLRRGARQVFAIDVGHEQMVDELYDNPKVVCVEGFNARELSPETLSERTGIAARDIKIDLLVGDLSFISLTLVMQQMLSVAPNAEFVLLIKPQFEVGKQSLNANGLVNDHTQRAFAIKQVAEEAARLKLGIRGLERSELPGTHGNIEYLIWISPKEALNQSQWTQRIEEIAKEPK